MKKHTRLAGLASAIALGTILQAQTAPAPAPAASPASPEATGETVELPRFTVTSERDVSYIGKEALSTTRIAVELSDLPQSVTVLNKAFIDNASPTILAKSLTYVGGAQTGTITWSVDRYMIRGFVGEGDFVDGFLTATDKNTDLNLVDHVEIIKGPAAIFVANQAQTVGGVINKIAKSPTDYPVGSFSVQLGMWDANRADFDIGGPVAPGSKLSYRLLVARQDSRGYFDYQYEKRSSILPMLAYRFNKDTQIWLKYETFNSHYSSYNGIPLDGRTGKMAAIARKTNLSGNTPNAWRTDWYNRLWGQFTTSPAEWLNIRLAAFNSQDYQRKVEAIPNKRFDTVQTVGTDPVTGAPLTVTVPGYVIPATYVPGQLISRNITAVNSDYQPRREIQNDYVFTFDTGSVSHKLLVGTDLLDYPRKTRFFDSGGAITATATPIDPFNPQLGTASDIVSVNFNQPPSQVADTSQNFAKVFALETASFLNNRIIANIGVSRNRFESSKSSLNYNQVTGVFATPTNVPAAVLYKNLVQFGLVVKPVKNISVFYGENSNFATTGFSGSTLNPPGEGKQKEAGLKTTWLNDRLGFNISYFNVVQFNNVVPAFPQTALAQVVVVGGETSRGFDGDFTFAITKNLDVIGSFAFFKAHIALAAPWNLIVQPGDGKVHKDIPVNNVSQNNFSMWTRYKFNEGTYRGLSFGVGVNSLDKRAIDDNSGSQVFYGYLPARVLMDASISYQTKRFTYQINVDNLLNNDYVYASRSSLVIVPGTPRNIRASITYRFR